MVLMRVPLQGAGGIADPLRADLPTYGYVGHDPVAGVIIVDVPDTDAPPNLPAPGTPARPNTVNGPVLIQVPAGDRAAWTATMRARYPARGANYNPPNPQ